MRDVCFGCPSKNTVVLDHDVEEIRCKQLPLGPFLFSNYRMMTLESVVRRNNQSACDPSCSKISRSEANATKVYK